MLILGGFLPSTDHILVPEHELMSDKEIKELLKDLDIVPENLPKILESDPQAVKLGAKPGNIIKIERRDGKISYPYYRIVIEG